MIKERELSMSSTQLIRWSGLANILAGILIVLFSLLHPTEVNPPPDPAVVLNSPWALIHTLVMLAAVFILLGLVGIYARQIEQIGWFGLIAFLTAFVGNALLIGFWFFDAFVIPILAFQTPTLLTDKTLLMSGAASGPFVIAYLLGGVISVLGFILLAAASIRANILPRWASGLMLIGAPIFTFSPHGPILIGGAILLGLGLVWLGYALWAEQSPVAVS
jgi:hypothetical protein